MIEMFARLYCDRCNAMICEMFNVDSLGEAENRVEENSGANGYACDEDGHDVCAACWVKWNTAHPNEEPVLVNAGATTVEIGATESAQSLSSSVLTVPQETTTDETP